MGDTAELFEGDAPPESAVSSYRHPVATGFHMLFRTLAILSYLFCNLFNSNNFVLNFILIVLLLSFDFWTVKNVSGRLLVGLRWWNKVKDDGTSEWVFESKKGRAVVSPTESRIFWFSLYIFMGLWILFAFTALINGIQWLLVVAVAVPLNAANVVGYTKCQKDAKERLQSFAGDFLARTVMQQAASMATGQSTQPQQRAAAHQRP
eukprot:Opistho-2@81176